VSDQEMIECPEHGGGFDCTPFCKTCEGEQGYYPTSEVISEKDLETLGLILESLENRTKGEK
jgi:hypothetical protein